MECPRCRHENRARAAFCGACGASLAGPPPFAAPPQLAEKILRSRRALEGERKLVTVLFADIVHSMELTEAVDTEDWHRVLDRFFQILAAGIHRYEGTVSQFTGDGVMALFGAPIAHEDHARRACLAALDLMDAVGAYASGLADRGLAFSVRMGLNSGEVVLGRIGDDLRMEYTALGHTVGLAERVEQLAAPGTVYLTEHTARLVEGFFTLDDHGTPAMKGVRTPVRVHRLRGTGTLRTRLDASRRRGFSRLVGREDELASLERHLAAARAADGRVVGVAGDAGVGKSRVCLEFVARCRADGVAVHEAHCPAHGAAIPLLPVRELVRDCLGVAAGEPDEARLVRERAAALGVDAIALLDLLGLAGDAAPPAAEVGPVVASLVRALAANGPVVLLLDDVHWIDPASEAVLGAIAAATPGARLLVVTNFRPDYAGRWMDAPHVARLPLAPLAPDASQALLADLLGPDVSLAALVDVLGERTGGNPFFIEEVVQALASAGSLAGHPGAYRLAAPLDTLAIPETVHALLAARIDRLGSDAKHVLQVAAVIGKQFDRPLLDAVAGRETDAVGQALAGLAETGLVHDVGGDDGTRYAFRHPLTQEVAYHGQLGDRRALLHAAVASAIETLMAERLGEHAALIAHHWRAAGMRWEAERWTRRAALRVASIRLRGRGRMPAPRA